MTILIALIVIGVVVASAVVAWLGGGRRDRPFDPTSPTRLFVLAYIGFYAVGSVVLLITGESAGAGPLVVAGGLAAFAIGTWLAERRFGPIHAMAEGATIGRLSPVVLALLAALGLACLASIAVAAGLPLLADDPQGSRGEYAGIVFDIFRWFVPAAALVVVGIALARDRPADRRIVWVAGGVLGATLFILIELASRALVFELAIEALLLAWWAGRRLSPRVWAGLAAAGLIVFVGVQLVRSDPDRGFTGPDDVVGFAVRRTIDRVLLIHPRTLEVVATTIPAEEPYFAGATYVRRLAVLLGAPERPSLGYWLYARLFPAQPGGFAAPGVLGEAWANGGPLLAGLLMLLLGVGAHAAGRWIARLPSGAADRALAAIVAVAIARSYATSLNGLLLTIVVMIGWWVLVRLRVGPPLPIAQATGRAAEAGS